jgi:hypothetical protein
MLQHKLFFHTFTAEAQQPQVLLAFVVAKLEVGEDLLRVLQFLSVSGITPVLHAHSFIYHRRCIVSTFGIGFQ